MWVGNNQHACTCYKISDNEAINVTDLCEKIKVRPDAICNVTGKIIPIHAEITDLEKVALALLDRYQAFHPGLDGWIKALIRNPDEGRSLDTFTNEEAPMEQGEAREGKEEKSPIQAAILNGIRSTQDQPSSNAPSMRQVLDAHLLTLAEAVRNYRNSGRPDGELTATVKMDESNASYVTIKSSLTRSVLEFHDQIVNLVAQANPHHPK
jgi:hypothetical protein